MRRPIIYLLHAMHLTIAEYNLSYDKCVWTVSYMKASPDIIDEKYNKKMYKRAQIVQN